MITHSKWLVVPFAWFGLALAGSHAAEPADVSAVKIVFKDYKNALERRDATPVAKLFTTDAQVLDSGGVKGTFCDRA